MTKKKTSPQTKNNKPAQKPKVDVQKSKLKIEENISSNIKEEIYIPSLNTEKYNTQKTKTEYKILVIKNDFYKLQEDVTNHLNDGWELAGGLSTSITVSQFESVTVFAQAIVKR